MNWAQMKEDWPNRSVHERQILTALALFSLLVIFYLIIMKPVAKYYSEAEQNLRAANYEATLVDAAIENVKSMQNRKPSEPIASVGLFQKTITDTASSASITISRLQQDSSGTINIRLDEVAPYAFYNWVSNLQIRHGVLITQATISALGKTDLVKVQMQLKLP